MSREVCGICWCPYDEDTGCEPAPKEPVQEPVFEVGFGWLDDATKYPKGTKLYTAPPQRKPLMEEELSRLFRAAGSPLAFARAIERAHGIGGQP